ncbi:hypothetical protein QM565_02565 [Geitlerinema splendidum]|nr:hypothetical protein [Geitlerinema splendidum]
MPKRRHYLLAVCLVLASIAGTLLVLWLMRENDATPKFLEVKRQHWRQIAPKEIRWYLIQGPTEAAGWINKGTGDYARRSGQIGWDGTGKYAHMNTVGTFAAIPSRDPKVAEEEFSKGFGVKIRIVASGEVEMPNPLEVQSLDRKERNALFKRVNKSYEVILTETPPRYTTIHALYLDTGDAIYVQPTGYFRSNLDGEDTIQPWSVHGRFLPRKGGTYPSVIGKVEGVRGQVNLLITVVF